MKYILACLLQISLSSQAQSNLSFDKRFVETEDKWIALKSRADSIFGFGFVYIDGSAGLTLDYSGTFKISPDGTFVPEKIENAGYKKRLPPTDVKVAIIPAAKLKELDVAEIPDWLHIYKGDTNSVQRLQRWGYHYNSFGECARALQYLERAQKIDPKYEGLAFELAYAYNCLKNYDKAISTLIPAVKTSPNDCLLHKELSYAEIKLGKLDQAAATTKKAISLCTANALKAELAYNLTYSFYEQKDKPNYKLWADETRKWATKGDNFYRNIDLMEAELNR